MNHYDKQKIVVVDDGAYESHLIEGELPTGHYMREKQGVVGNCPNCGYEFDTGVLNAIDQMSRNNQPTPCPNCGKKLMMASDGSGLTLMEKVSKEEAKKKDDKKKMTVGEAVITLAQYIPEMNADFGSLDGWQAEKLLEVIGVKPDNAYDFLGMTVLQLLSKYCKEDTVEPPKGKAVGKQDPVKGLAVNKVKEPEANKI